MYFYFVNHNKYVISRNWYFTPPAPAGTFTNNNFFNTYCVLNFDNLDNQGVYACFECPDADERIWKAVRDTVGSALGYVKISLTVKYGETELAKVERLTLQNADVDKTNRRFYVKLTTTGSYVFQKIDESTVYPKRLQISMRVEETVYSSFNTYDYDGTEAGYGVDSNNSYHLIQIVSQPTVSFQALDDIPLDTENFSTNYPRIQATFSQFSYTYGTTLYPRDFETITVNAKSAGYKTSSVKWNLGYTGTLTYYVRYGFEVKDNVTSTYIVDESSVATATLLESSDITIRYLTRNESNEDVWTNLTLSDVTISPASYTLEEITNQEQVVMPTITWQDSESRQYSTQFNLVVALEKYDFVAFTKVDNSTYFLNEEAYFDTEITAVTIVDHEGTETTISWDSDSISDVSIHLPGSTVAISEGDSVGLWTYVEVDFKYTASSGIVYTFKNARLNLGERVNDVLTSINLGDQISLIVCASFASQLSKFVGKVTAIYQSGNQIVISDPNRISFNALYDDLESVTRVADAPTAANIPILIDGQSATVSGTVTYSLPAQAYAEIVGLGKTDFLLPTDKIDLSNIRMHVTYSDGATYSEDVHFSNLAVVIRDKTDTTSVVTNVAYFNGTNPLSESGITIENNVPYKEFILRISTDDPANIILNETLTIDVPIKVYSTMEIFGVMMLNIYSDYKAGEHFLKDEDTTRVRLYFKDSSSNVSFVDANLKDEFSGLSVLPYKGAELTNVTPNQRVIIKSVVNPDVMTEYSIKVMPRNVSDSTIYHDLVGIWKKSIYTPDGETITSDKGVIALVDRSDTYVVNGIITERLLPDTIKIYGYIADIFDSDKQARVVLFDDYVPPIDGASNINVLYPSYKKGSADQINKATFGVLFGTNNATNRLFVSGNPDYPNADWHTSEINRFNDTDAIVEKTNGDFSYFADESIMYYGETDNKVIGYDIVSNDKLFVLKTKSDKEKTVYFRTPIALKSLDSSGNEQKDISGDSLYQEEFALVKGNNSVAGVSPKSIINFNGDTLFIDSDKHLSGLDLTGIIGDSQRYATSRSKFIDEKLKNLDTENTILWTNNKYLFMSIPNYGIFATHFEKKGENNQYEWWFLTCENPTTFIEIDNVIYFANDKGEVYKVTDKFVDIKKIFIGEGDSVISEIETNANTITYSSSLNLDPNKRYKLRVKQNDDYRKDLYFKVASLGSSLDYSFSNYTLSKRMSSAKDLLDKGTYYIGSFKLKSPPTRPSENAPMILWQNYYNRLLSYQLSASSASALYGERLTVKRIDQSSTGLDKFELFTNDGSHQNLSAFTDLSLFRRISDIETDIVDIDTTNHSFRLSLDGEELDIERYGNQMPFNLILDAEICEYSNVEAYYITAPFTMGGLNNFKTIWSFTVTNDTNIPSELFVGYASNKVPIKSNESVQDADSKTLAALSRAEMGLNFDDIDYVKADFDKSIVPRTYTTNRVLGMQKFICFAFKNENDTNAVLSAMSVVYTVPFPSYGGD